MEEDITPETLLAAVRDLYQKRMTYVNNMALSEQNDAIGKIMELITANSSNFIKLYKTECDNWIAELPLLSHSVFILNFIFDGLNSFAVNAV